MKNGLPLLGALLILFTAPIVMANDTILIFTAKWCPACVKMEQTVWPKVDTTGYKVYKVDIDEVENATRDYKIHTIPTVIIGKESDGKFTESKRHAQSMTLEETKKFLAAP